MALYVSKAQLTSCLKWGDLLYVTDHIWSYFNQRDPQTGIPDIQSVSYVCFAFAS